jgi:hypothetical protein
MICMESVSVESHPSSRDSSVSSVSSLISNLNPKAKAFFPPQTKLQQLEEESRERRRRLAKEQEGWLECDALDEGKRDLMDNIPIWMIKKQEKLGFYPALEKRLDGKEWKYRVCWD